MLWAVGVLFAGGGIGFVVLAMPATDRVWFATVSTDGCCHCAVGVVWGTLSPSTLLPDAAKVVFCPQCQGGVIVDGFHFDCKLTGG